jgi:hypothetical protein
VKGVRRFLRRVLPGAAAVMLLLGFGVAVTAALYDRSLALPAAVPVVVAGRVTVPGTPEGLALAPDGSAVVTVMDGRVLRRAGDGWIQLGGPLPGALAVVTDPLGGFLTAASGGLWRWSGEISTGAGEWELLSAIPGTPNGLAARGHKVWVSTEPLGWRLWEVERRAADVRLRSLGRFWMPNGLALLPDADGEEELLLVAEMLGGRIWQVNLRTGSRQLLVRLPLLQFVDGLLLLSDGRLLASTNAGYLYVIETGTGRVMAVLRLQPEDAAANMVQAGDRLWAAAIGRANLLRRPLFPGRSLLLIELPR